ncbi:hypothetical protein ACU4GD_29885 [Cupriavidus basilensis]
MVVIAPPIFDHIAGLEHGLSLLDRERAAIASAAAKARAAGGAIYRGGTVG